VCSSGLGLYKFSAFAPVFGYALDVEQVLMLFYFYGWLGLLFLSFKGLNI